MSKEWPCWFYDVLIYMLRKDDITEEGRKLLEKWYCDEMTRGGREMREAEELRKAREEVPACHRGA